MISLTLLLTGLYRMSAEMVTRRMVLLMRYSFTVDSGTITFTTYLKYIKSLQ
jgi:hypothetical protein